jgi:hypothetical protein
MATNNFGDNWLSDEERAYWGVDEYGNPAQIKQKTERQLDNEWREKRFRTNVSYWIMMTVALGIGLFWLYVALALVLKFGFGYNIVTP